MQLERLIAADLTHAGIAAPIAAGVVEISAYLAMDFVAADSLDIVIRDQELTSPSDIVRLASQLASALDLAASINITHGSLHPRDVLISADDVRMTGIGIARALEEIGLSAPIRRPYTAPERSNGASWDRRADVFSLAALVYELLTRRRISGPGSQPYDAFASVAGVSADALDKLFDRALAEQPGDRFATAGDFAKALQAAVERKRSANSRVGPTIRPPAPEPVVERTLSAPQSGPLPVEELPLFTDSMLGEIAPGPAAAEADPPALMRFAHETDAPDLSFRDAPLSTVDSAEDLEQSNGHERLIEDFQSVAHDAGGPRLSIDDFSETEHDAPPLRNEHSLPAGQHLDEMASELASTRSQPELAINQEFVRQTADVPEPPSRVAPFESRPAPFETVESIAAAPSSSGIWPLMLALVVGIALGFGMAMLLLGRDRVPPAPQQASAAPTTGTAATEVRDEPIREVTEQQVATPAGSAGQLVPSPPTAASVPLPPPAASVKPAETNPVASVPSKPAVPATKAAPVAKIAPTPAKPAPNASKANAATASAGRGTNKSVAAAPAKPAGQGSPKTSQGTLVVESRPSGATVFLDGRRVGTTPLTIDTLKTGQYTIGLDITGYKRWASSVKITSGDRSRVSASLER